jgi:hypothetical protein
MKRIPARDLLGHLAESGGDGAKVLGHGAFDFLRKHRPMPLGNWVAALRETARVLASVGPGKCLIGELPQVCRPDGDLLTGLLPVLVRVRNPHVHPDGSIRSTDEECRRALREFRPPLDAALRQLQFVCRYPLGFLSPFTGLSAPAGQRYFHLHACMGAWIGSVSKALDIKTSVELREGVPFVAAQEGRRLLYLWPLLLERRSAYTGRRTLWVFQDIPDNRRPFLTTIRSAAIDVREDYTSDLHPEPATSHTWLLECLRALPATAEVPAELQLAEKLFPMHGGKLVGEKLGSNRLLSVVAIGGFGTIYAGEADDGQRVAVKVIERRASDANLARFSQEIEKLHLSAEHPGIIRSYEQGDIYVGGHICPWYSMEFALGGDLRSRMDQRKAALQGRIPWNDLQARKQVCREFSAIADAVAHLHRHHIVHRDVKPGNVLIMEDGALRLSDFGLVKNLAPSEDALRRGPHSTTGGGAGTPDYMAPEQARGESVECTADVYSLGILLAELVSGERPKLPSPSADDDVASAARSTLKNWKALGELPAGVRALISD